MKPGSIFYAAFCLFALVWLASSNMRGFIPFVVNAANADRGATNSLFHK